jgi:hypothetical protein
MLPSVDKNVVALDIPASDRAQVHDRKLLKSQCQVTKAYLGHINFVRKYSPTKPYIWSYVFLYGWRSICTWEPNWISIFLTSSWYSYNPLLFIYVIQHACTYVDVKATFWRINECPNKLTFFIIRTTLELLWNHS